MGTTKNDFIGAYLDKKMKDHGLPYGMAYLNLLAKHEDAAEKTWNDLQKRLKYRNSKKVTMTPETTKIELHPIQNEGNTLWVDKTNKDFKMDTMCLDPEGIVRKCVGFDSGRLLFEDLLFVSVNATLCFPIILQTHPVIPGIPAIGEVKRKERFTYEETRYINDKYRIRDNGKPIGVFSVEDVAKQFCNYLNRKSNVDVERLADKFVEDYKTRADYKSSLMSDGMLATGFVYGFNTSPKGKWSDEDMIAFPEWKDRIRGFNYKHYPQYFDITRDTERGNMIVDAWLKSNKELIEIFKAETQPPLTITISMQGGEIVRDADNKVQFTVND